MSSDKPQSISELYFAIGDSTPKRIMLDMTLARNHSVRVRCVQNAIDYIAQEIMKSRQHSQDFSEDEITDKIIISLKSMGFSASHDTQFGGHCDIAIEGRDEFLWIAEAKIHRGGYERLFEGFQQLDTRYTTGLPGQDNGEIILYIYQENMEQVMNRWSDELQKRRPEIQINACDRNILHRITRHKHARSGLVFTVRHVPISLFFKPEA